MKRSELKNWCAVLTNQQEAVLRMLWMRSLFGRWTSYRDMHKIANTPTARITELRQAGVEFKHRKVKVMSNSGQRMVNIEEFMI